MNNDDSWKGEHLLYGIKADRREANGWNIAGGKKLRARLKDAQQKAPKSKRSSPKSKRAPS